MPFKCNLTLGNSLNPNTKIEFVSWVKEVWESDSEWGNIVPENTPYAIARENGATGKIFTSFRCALMEKGKLIPGDIIKKDTIIATVAAEGDEIPYNHPLSEFRKNT